MSHRNKNGLDLIEKLSITNQSFLFTSHYEEKDVQLRAEKMGVKIIPKSMVYLIPIENMSRTPLYLAKI